MQLYVRGSSKKALNEALKAGETLIGTHFDVFGDSDFISEQWQIGDVIKVYDRCIGGTPVAKAYGTVARDRAGNLVIR